MDAAFIELFILNSLNELFKEKSVDYGIV